MTTILDEAKRLWELGCGVHWIKPNSKAPVKEKWSAPERDPWEVVKKDYRPGYGLGVRLGEPSKLEGGYLANIDVDIKSDEPRHRDEALTVVESFFPGVLKKAPIVKTSYGLRLFVKTPEPVKSGKLGASSEETVVYLPTAAVNQRQLKAASDGVITQDQLARGFRVRGAWEVELMSAGKQVVLPPSIHPETGRPYIWERPLVMVSKIPEVAAPTGKLKEVLPKETGSLFTPVAVDLVGSTLPNTIVDMILSGKGVTDRSAACFTASMAMVKAGFSDDEILSILTDKDTFLGETAYEHRSTTSRVRAADWVRGYCLKKAKYEVSAARAFEAEVDVLPPLESPEAIVNQLRELIPEAVDWREKIVRTGKNGDGPPKVTLLNIVIILEGVYGPVLFKEDLFSGYRIYAQDTPWGGKTDAEFSDREVPLLTEWFAKKWQFQPKRNDLYDAVIILAAKNPFHPIKDYLKSLRWDGVERIDYWLRDYMRARDADADYLREVSRKVLVAMIARIFQPGIKFDHMLILKGKQGIKKSTALNILAGTKYYTSAILEAGNKDTILKMMSKWVIEFGELSTFNKDIQKLKNFMTTVCDRDRLPFAHLAQDFPRKCIFIGTTNQDDFLNDASGDRRYWPVAVEKVDTERLEADRDQLLAEALNCYELGETLYLSEEVEKKAALEQARWRPDEDAIIDRIAAALERNARKENNDMTKFSAEGFRLSDIIYQIEGKDDRQTQMRVAAALKSLGYKKDTVKNTRVWVKNNDFLLPLTTLAPR